MSALLPALAVLLAHVGHWAAQLLYLLPVFAVVAWISVQALRERRRDRPPASAGPSPGPPD
jgi:cytochrome c-type biogenesis protein CcmH/NrfF